MIEYKSWLNVIIYDVIYDKINRQSITIPIPFYQGSGSMDNAIKNFLNLESTYIPDEPSPHNSLDSIISIYESLHVYVTYYIIHNT